MADILPASYMPRRIPREPTVWRRTLQLIARTRPAKLVEERVKGGEDELLFARYFIAKIPEWSLFGRLAGGAIYLHHYMQPDKIDAVHDHPWEYAIAMPLVAGYWERRLVGFRKAFAFEGRSDLTRLRARVRQRKAFRPYTLRGGDFHTIEALRADTAWSLFLHGPFVKQWGMLYETDTGVEYRVNPKQNNAASKGSWWRDAKLGRFYNA